jgi:hypothetical protein
VRKQHPLVQAKVIFQVSAAMGNPFKSTSQRPTLLRLAMVLAAMLMGWITPVTAQVRFWTDSDGHHYEATIVSLYHDQATFQHPDGRTFTLAIGDLTPNDQAIVREWLAKQPLGMGESPPPTMTLSHYGREFLLDEPRVLRLRALADQGYLSSYLGIPLILRDLSAGPLDFVNVYFYDDERRLIPFPLPPPDSPIMIQDGITTSFIKPADVKPGTTYMVLIPIRDPSIHEAAYDLVVAGNSLQAVATVFPEGSWRDFDFPEHSLIAIDKYADYSGQELYTEKKPDSLFAITDVTRLQPANGDHSPDHDYFRLSLSILQPFPAVALAGRWYAFDKNDQLIHSEDLPPYAVPNRKDGFFVISQTGTGPADISEAIMPTDSDARDTLQLPGAAWWDKPEVDSIVFVFGTETKKVARLFSKSNVSILKLPIPEVQALMGALPAAEAEIPVRTY